MYCDKCGVQLNDDARFCYNCGSKVMKVNEQEVLKTTIGTEAIPEAVEEKLREKRPDSKKKKKPQRAEQKASVQKKQEQTFHLEQEAAANKKREKSVKKPKEKAPNAPKASNQHIKLWVLILLSIVIALQIISTNFGFSGLNLFSGVSSFLISRTIVHFILWNIINLLLIMFVVYSWLKRDNCTYPHAEAVKKAAIYLTTIKAAELIVIGLYYTVIYMKFAEMLTDLIYCAIAITLASLLLKAINKHTYSKSEQWLVAVPVRAFSVWAIAVLIFKVAEQVNYLLYSTLETNSIYFGVGYSDTFYIIFTIVELAVIAYTVIQVLKKQRPLTGLLIGLVFAAELQRFWTAGLLDTLNYSGWFAVKVALYVLIVGGAAVLIMSAIKAIQKLKTMKESAG